MTARPNGRAIDAECEARSTIGAALHRSNFIDPDTGDVWIVLGDFLYLAEQWDRAESVFRELHEEDPTEVAPLGYLGVLAARRGDTERATEISTALSRQHFHPLFTRIPDQQRCWRARIAAVLGRREEAVTLLRPIFHRTTPDGHPLHAHAEMDFESLRDYPPFLALVGPEG